MENLLDGVEIVGEFSPQREHGGIAAAGTGAFISYDFKAGSLGTLSISLAGIDANWPDMNPIINGLTLELIDPDAIPGEVDKSSAADFGSFTGADQGEGLDLAGNFVFAVNLLGPGGGTAGDATFTADDSTANFAVTAQNAIIEWATTEFGDTANDDALEAVMSSIRWSGHPTPVNLTLGGQPTARARGGVADEHARPHGK